MPVSSGKRLDQIFSAPVQNTRIKNYTNIIKRYNVSQENKLQSRIKHEGNEKRLNFLYFPYCPKLNLSLDAF